ncbi:replication protein [Rhodococcus ruber]
MRRAPRPTSNYTVVRNETIGNKDLSFRARAVLIWLLSKPADWRIRSDAIAAESPTEGRDAIRSAMRELAARGHLVTERRQNEHGQWITVQTVYEVPVRPEPGPGNPNPGEPDTGEPGAEQSTEDQETETNPSPAAEPAAPSARPQGVISIPEKKQIGELATACRAAGLTATFDYLPAAARSQIVALIDSHGIPPLVTAARSTHRPNNPTRFAHAWIPLWQALPLPRSPLPPRCGRCDEYGWLPDDDRGRAVRCPCRRFDAPDRPVAA